ncbi:hypothetical protein C8N31_104237 [Sulfitobacter mediterraneus]|jgi:hypothetical protein|uniref:DUF465 domain-containing protein n=2 Tax=Sulfitobacter mediterraneus TaxID=83219 RepID=A0A2T6CFR9_9RHOB|nr:hypothetical protein C8N31_104237 [Sulfitobacter mediterraneus]
MANPYIQRTDAKRNHLPMTDPQDLSMKNDDVLRVELEVFRREHRDLDEAIHALVDRKTGDQLTLQRLKKRKLRLKDLIAQIEDRLTPDIIA